MSVGLRKTLRKGPALGKASIKWAAADSINGATASIALREAAKANSEDKGGRAGPEGAGGGGNAAATADLVAAGVLCAWRKIPACAPISVSPTSR